MQGIYSIFRRWPFRTSAETLAFLTEVIRGFSQCLQALTLKLTHPFRIIINQLLDYVK